MAQKRSHSMDSSGSDSSDKEVGFIKRRNKKNDLKLLSTYDSDSASEADSDLIQEDQKQWQPSNTIQKSDDNTSDKIHEDSDMFASEDDNDDANDIHKDSLGTEKIDHKEQSHLLDVGKFIKDNLGEDAEIVDDRLENHLSNHVSHEIASDDDIRVEAFSIEEDLKNGIFDKDGNYVQNGDSNTNDSKEEDKWMNEFNNIEESIRSKEKSLLISKEEKKKLRKQGRHYTIDEALIRLKFLVGNGNSVLQMLGVLNQMRMSKSTKENEFYFSNAINLLTDIIEILQQKGVDDVYNLTKEHIVTLIKEESFSDINKIDETNDKIWSFQWLNKQGKIHEYHSCKEMQYWKDNYFKDGVIIKFKEEENKPENWIHVSCIYFS